MPSSYASRARSRLRAHSRLREVAPQPPAANRIACIDILGIRAMDVRKREFIIGLFRRMKSVIERGRSRIEFTARDHRASEKNGHFRSILRIGIMRQQSKNFLRAVAKSFCKIPLADDEQASSTYFDPFLSARIFEPRMIAESRCTLVTCFVDESDCEKLCGDWGGLRERHCRI